MSSPYISQDTYDNLDRLISLINEFRDEPETAALADRLDAVLKTTGIDELIRRTD